METRTVEYLNKKIEQIDAKIEKCFESFDEANEHIAHYKINDGKITTETTYVSVSSMVINIQRLEDLRMYYLKKIDKSIRLHTEKQ